jgi:hypothetical protein
MKHLSEEVKQTLEESGKPLGPQVFDSLLAAWHAERIELLKFGQEGAQFTILYYAGDIWIEHDDEVNSCDEGVGLGYDDVDELIEMLKAFRAWQEQKPLER